MSRRALSGIKIYHRNTLDLDFCDKDTLQRITDKLKQCKHMTLIKSMPSCTKGYHVIFWCDIDCDLCRLTFDSQLRFERDLKRKARNRDVLFTDKRIVPGAELANRSSSKTLEPKNKFNGNLKALKGVTF